MYTSAITGIVVHGGGTSHTLGFPTINIQDTPSKMMGGTRRVHVSIDKTTYIGVGPCFPDRGLREIHILGYTGDLYGKEVSIFPQKKLRENISFKNKEELIQQLHKDVEQARISITGITFGTFDHFHPGHKQYLLQAKQRCNRLVTIVARDKNVTLLKHKQAQHDEHTRLTQVLDSEIPDIVVLGHEKNHFNCLTTYAPDVICLGYDQLGFSEGLQEFYSSQGLQLPTIVRLSAYKPEKRKSSLLS